MHMTITINKLDLNLLRVFDAVMEERSVLRASQRVCLSQSAVSHALARLRQMLEDELFIRTPTGMQPTARALEMAPLVREAWQSLEKAIGPAKFDPANSSRRFTIAVSDFVATVMVPNLLDLIRHEAPQIDLVIRSDSRIDLAEQIDLGQIDCAIGTFSEPPTRFRSSSLFDYDDVLMVSSSRKLGKLTPDVLSGLSVAVVSLHGQHEGLVDGFVCERGLTRRSEMYDRGAFEDAFSAVPHGPRKTILLPHFLALPKLLEQTDVTAIVPRPLAKSLASTHALSVRELPYKTPTVEVSVLWHERTIREPSQEWLRNILKRASEPLRTNSIQSNGVAGARAKAFQSTPNSAPRLITSKAVALGESSVAL